MRVRRRVGESQGCVDVQRRGVVRLDVEQHLVDLEAVEVGQPGEGQHPAEPAALGGRTDRDDIDLALGRIVLLGPVEAEEGVVGVDGDQQSGRLKPRLGHPLGEAGGVHRTLLGVTGECARIHREERSSVPVVVGPDRDADRQLQCGERVDGGSAQHPQLSATTPAVPRREPYGARMVAVRPGPIRRPVGPASPASAASPASPVSQRCQPPTCPGPTSRGAHRERQLTVEQQREPVGLDPDLCVVEPLVLEVQGGSLVERVGLTGAHAGAAYGSERLQWIHLQDVSASPRR